MRKQFQEAASYAGLTVFCGSCTLLNAAQAITIDSPALGAISTAAAVVSAIVGTVSARNAVREFGNGIERTTDENMKNLNGPSPH